jgi:hypothetical protein
MLAMFNGVNPNAKSLELISRIGKEEISEFALSTLDFSQNIYSLQSILVVTDLYVSRHILVPCSLVSATTMDITEKTILGLSTPTRFSIEN